MLQQRAVQLEQLTQELEQQAAAGQQAQQAAAGQQALEAAVAAITGAPLAAMTASRQSSGPAPMQAEFRLPLDVQQLAQQLLAHAGGAPGGGMGSHVSRTSAPVRATRTEAAVQSSFQVLREGSVAAFARAEGSSEQHLATCKAPNCRLCASLRRAKAGGGAPTPAQALAAAAELALRQEQQR